jgi:hypothetical protein
VLDGEALGWPGVEDARPREPVYGAYLYLSTLAALVVAAVLLTAYVSIGAAWVSLQTWLLTVPEASAHLWRDSYFAQTLSSLAQAREVGGWLALKAASCGLAASAIGIWLGTRAKRSILDINAGVAAAIGIAISAVLLIHTALTTIEFREPPASVPGLAGPAN